MKYELMAILDPKMTDKETEKIIIEIKETFAENGLELKDEDIWGHRDLAYKIKGHDAGYYLVMNFEGESDGVVQINNDLRILAGVLRYLLVKVPDDYALMRYEQIVQERAKKQKLSSHAEELQKKISRKKKVEAPVKEEEKEEEGEAPVEVEEVQEIEVEEAVEEVEEVEPEVQEIEVEEEEKEKEKEDSKLDEKLKAIIDDTDLNF